MRILGELLQSEEIQFCCFSDSIAEMKIQQHAILHQTKSIQFIYDKTKPKATAKHLMPHQSEVKGHIYTEALKKITYKVWESVKDLFHLSF